MAKVAKRKLNRLTNVLLYGVIFAFAAYLAAVVPSVMGKFSTERSVTPNALADSPHFGDGGGGDGLDGGCDGFDGFDCLDAGDGI